MRHHVRSEVLLLSRMLFDFAVCARARYVDVGVLLGIHFMNLPRLISAESWLLYFGMIGLLLIRFASLSRVVARSRLDEL